MAEVGDGRPDGAQRRGRVHPLRKPLEALFGALWRDGWAARLTERHAGTTGVREVRHELALGGRLRTRLRIAFLSDLHVGPTTSARALDRAFELAAAARPDVLALGGDYVFLEATRERLDELERRVRDVPAPLKVGVLGNHDLWTDFRAVERALERAGVELLTNRALALAGEHAGVALLGIDDPLSGAPDPAAALADAAGARVRVALCHSPEGLASLAGRVDLLLAGHTHGGQVATPLGPLYVPGRAGRRHPHGLFEVDGTRLFVSRGVGGVGMPLRAFAPPDVAVLDLV